MRKAVKEVHKRKGSVVCIEDDGTLGTKLSNKELKRRRVKRQMATASKRANRQRASYSQQRKNK